MICYGYCESPLGRILLAERDDALFGLWLEGEKYYPDIAVWPEAAEQESPVIRAAKGWLSDYFAGCRPSPSTLPLAPDGTDFQKLIWRQLAAIPYGESVTYGELSRLAAAELGKARMSAQAVGGAVGRNPISIIVPCHRVLGADGSLTGYAGGLDRKLWLLEHEGIVK